MDVLYSLCFQLMLLTIATCDSGSEFQSIDEAIMAAGGGRDAFLGSFRSAAGGQVLAEFDMVLSPEQFKAMYLSNSADSRTKRKAASNIRKYWPEGKVNYYIVQSDFNIYDKQAIQAAIDEYEKLTCLKFIEVSPEDSRNKIRIKNGNGCNSQLGMTGGTQNLNLGSGCRYVGTVIHELGHAIGWHHEHQLPDRDEYIEILYENVNPDWRIWFNRINSAEVNNYGVHYDYKGIMHYGIRAFSDKGEQTIRAKDPSKEYLIQDTWHKHTLAWSDVKVANAQYRCSAHCPSNLSGKCPSDSFLNKDCQCQFENGRLTDPSTGSEIKPETKPDDCVDNDGRCKFWADLGECKKNPNYMIYNCMVSCGTCPGQVRTTANPNCLDQNDSCPNWANMGECERNPGYMLYNCKKSCKQC